MMREQPPHRFDPAANSRSSPTGGLSDFPRSLVEVTLERLVASDTFRRSQRHRRFLTHVIRAGLDGRRDQLKEVIIGIEVFGRALPAYDPRRDPIVRVEAGRLRDKLARFYNGEGAEESFQIVLPVGNYMPMFVRRGARGPGSAQGLSHALAVLPFANLTGDAPDTAFALGLADQLIDAIGRAPNLKVVGRLSSLKARDAGLDLKAIGKLLGVDHVVEGSLQRIGTRVRCIAQLSRTKDGMRVWSQRFDHDTGGAIDLFDFQDAIADAVITAVSALHDGAVADDWRRLHPAGTENREARDLFEQARHLTQQRTFEGYRKSIELLERAVVIDPGFAQAFSLLGMAHANKLGFNVEPTYPAFLSVEHAARRALELDPIDGEARSLLAVVAYRVKYRWKDAEPLFQEALRLAPSSTLVHSSFAWALVFNGQFDQAMHHARLSQELDPLNLGLRASNAAVAMYARRFDFAIREFNTVLQLEPDHLFARVVLGVTCLSMDELDQASEHFDHIARVAPDHSTPKFCRICVDGLRGSIDDGRRRLAALVVELRDRHYSRVNLAMAQTCLGDFDSAFVSLEYAARVHDLLFVSVPTHALFAPLRRDRRFAALLARHGLDPVTLPDELPAPLRDESPM